MDLNELYGNLKKSKWIWVISILVTIPVDLMLMLIPTCLAPILVGLVTFGIPYAFGVRSMKTFLKVGTVIILITGVLFGALLTYFMYEQVYYFEERTVGDTHLVDGIVTPYLGNDNTSFNYTVGYTGTEPPANITVYVNITDVLGEHKKNISLKKANGFYYNETLLDENTYYYHFAVHLHANDTWVETEQGFGPITIPYSDMLGIQILQGVLVIFLNAGLFFYMVLILFWWRRNAKRDRMKSREDLETEGEAKAESREEEILEEEDEGEEGKEGEEEEGKEEEKGEYTCTSCGADVDADATECPSCGEEFEDEDEDEEEELEVEVKE